MLDNLPYILIAFSLIVLVLAFLDCETQKIKVKEYTIENSIVTYNVSEYKGVKIVFFSDLHIGKLLKINQLKERLQLVKDLNADIYIFGGDLIGIDTIKHYSIEDIKECFEIFKDDVTLAIYGNHEYKKIAKGDELKLDYFNAMGFKVLNNQEFNYKKNDINLSIFGMQESIYHNNVKIEKKYDLIISHQGDVIDNLNNQIMLSGHTHGGQIRIPFIPIYYRPKKGKKYRSGYYKNNNNQLIVSNGLGYGLMKVRLFSPCDIIVIDYR